jgi:acetolactate decarboxylase
MKKILLIVLILLGCFCTSTKGQERAIPAHEIFQYSTLSALLEGVYDGNLTIGELRKHGNFGMGTFNALNGEMILLDGKCYQATSDGKILSVPDSTLTPFAVALNFSPDTIIRLNRRLTMAELDKYLDQLITKPNLISVYRIRGSFDSISIRSVPKQPKPYKRLIEAYKQQGVFNLTKLDGTLIGFKFPSYLKEVNLDNYHFHFLANDKTKGGHILNCTISIGEIAIKTVQKYELQLPDNAEFNGIKLENKKKEIQLIEGSRK